VIASIGIAMAPHLPSRVSSRHRHLRVTTLRFGRSYRAATTTSRRYQQRIAANIDAQQPL